MSASKSFQKPCRISTLAFREKTLHDDGKDPLICLPLINFCYLAACFGVPEDELETLILICISTYMTLDNHLTLVTLVFLISEMRMK